MTNTLLMARGSRQKEMEWRWRLTVALDVVRVSLTASLSGELGQRRVKIMTPKFQPFNLEADEVVSYESATLVVNAVVVLESADKAFPIHCLFQMRDFMGRVEYRIEQQTDEWSSNLSTLVLRVVMRMRNEPLR